MKGVLFTYLLTFGGGPASLFKPYWGFLIYVAFAILRPEDLWGFALPSYPYSRVVAVAMLIGWLLNGCGSWRLGRARGIVVALVFYWFWQVLGAFFHPMQEMGWAQVEAQSKVYIPFLVGLTLIDSMKRLKQLVWVIVLTQGYLSYEFNLQYYSGWFVPDEFTFSGLDRNGIAITLCATVPMAFFLGMMVERWWQKLIAFAAAGLMVHVILFSLSRGGMLGLLITGIACFMLIEKRPATIAIFLLAVAVGLRLAGKEVRDRFSQVTDSQALNNDSSAQHRLNQWQIMLTSIPKQPLIGVGTRYWAYHMRATTGVFIEGHSTWLQVPAELGIPAICALGAFYGLCMARLWPYCRRSMDDPWPACLSRMVITSLVGFIVSAQFVTSDGVEIPYYVVLVGTGVLKLYSFQQAEEFAEENATTPSIESDVLVRDPIYAIFDRYEVS